MSHAHATTLARPPAADLWWLALAVVAISTSGPIIAACAAPALAIAFWRTFAGGALTAGWVGLRGRGRPAVSRESLQLMVWAGLALAAHFATWVPSLRYTTVASSTALVATQPVWAALIARKRGVAIPRQAWLGIAVALLGVLVLTGVDFSLDPRALIGDGLALAGAVLAAVYVTVGEQARGGSAGAAVDTATYTATCYLVAAAALAPVCLVAGVPFVGYSARDWALIGALTLGAQLLGHTLVNKVLASTSATVVSLAILFEMPGSTLIAAAWLGQRPPLGIVPAVVLLFAGLALVIRVTTTDSATESPPV